MFTLLRRVSIPEFRRHLLRNFLTLMGIALGVAIFAAARSADSSLKSSLRDTINRIAGKAVLQVTAGPAGLPEAVLDEVRAVPGVRAAVPVIEAIVRTTDASQGNILVLGVDMAGDQSMRDYVVEGADDAIPDPLVFLAQPDSLLVSADFATRNQLQEDSRIELVTAVGSRKFTVRGIMKPQGMATAFGGNIAVMDIYSAQHVFGRGQIFDRIDVTIDETLGIERVQGRIVERLGSGCRIEPPLRRGKQTESLMEAFNYGLFITSMIALMIGLFLIFNAFSVNVTERRTQIGILRALGVTRVQIQALFLAESFLLGLLGSAIGVVAGILMGRGMMLFLAQVVEQIHGVQVHLDRLHVDPFWTTVSFVMGTVASLVGAWLPARAAGRVDPALALQKGKFQQLFVGENRRRRWAGLALLASSLALGSIPWTNSVRMQIVVFVALFVSLALLAPTFSHLLAGLLRLPMDRFFRAPGQLAADSLIKAPRRTSATVSALLFGLTFVLVMGTFSASIKSSMLRWVDSSINPDLFVYASNSLTVRNFQFPASMAADLKDVPGVRQVDSVRILNIDFKGKAPLLVSVEMDQYLRRSAPIMEEGRLGDLLPGMIGRNGALISNNLSHIHSLHRGDRISLESPTGRHEFEVVGVQADYTSDHGCIVLDRAVYARLWKDDRVDVYELMLESSADPEQVKREIQRRFSASRNVFILTNKEMRSEILRITDQFFVLQYVQLLVAILVAVLGIVNSLMVSISERKREIGILRGLGGERSQVRSAILLEAVCVGLVATVLGIAGGAIMGYYAVTSFGAAFTGWIFPYRFPVTLALSLIPGVVAVSLIAAWYPSSRALATPIVEALAYE